MLKTLEIKNFAIIDSLKIEFIDGLNIITGETGAGKSIIVDAMMMILGERASVDFIRQGESKAVVEGTFNFPDEHPLFAFLDQNGFDKLDNEIIIRREINTKGNSRAFLNDSPINISLLKQFGDLLVDFHGQHEHQSLLNTENHIKILDMLGSYKKESAEYSASFSALSEAISAFSSLMRRESELIRKIDYQKFQLEDINKVNPLENEDSKIDSEINLLENAENLHNMAYELSQLLYTSDSSAYSSLVASEKLIRSLAEIDPQFGEFASELSSSLISIKEIGKFAREYDRNIEFNPDKIEALRQRLVLLRGLMKKYGDINQIIALKKQILSDLSLIENFDEEKDKLKKKIVELRIVLGQRASVLSKARKVHSAKIETDILKILHKLGMPNAVFRVESKNADKGLASKISDTALCAVIDDKALDAFPDGIDIIEYYISTNKGEMPLPLSNIVSGGEMSRIMLAIKSLLAETDSLPILIFDEIDTGISGHIAQKVGVTMKSLSKRHQIISITHLPQIAALGDRNIAVQKIDSNGRTVTTAKVLDDSEKFIEIAKMMSGENVTETSVKNAIELSKAVLDN